MSDVSAPVNLRTGQDLLRSLRQPAVDGKAATKHAKAASILITLSVDVIFKASSKIDFKVFPLSWMLIFCAVPFRSKAFATKSPPNCH